MRTIQVLGPGCARCRQLAENVEIAVRESGLPFEIRKVTDLAEMASFGVMATPALVVDGEVKVVGKVPSPARIREFLE